MKCQGMYALTVACGVQISTEDINNFVELSHDHHEWGSWFNH